MKRRILAATTLLLLGGALRSAAAQTALPPLGKWTIEYERGHRIENDVMTPIIGTGVLTVSQAGDSLSAVLEAGPRPDGSAVPPAMLRGRMTNDGAVFLQKRQVQINENGEASTREIVLTWTLRAVGDALVGSLHSEVQGDHMPMVPSPVKGTRFKS